MIFIALVNATSNNFITETTARLKGNINADVSDIARRLNEEMRRIEKRGRENVIKTLFIGGLFNYNYTEAKRALTKCIALKPSKEVTVKEANELLPVLWGSCRVLLKDDFSVLMDEIDRYFETEKEFGDDLPFV